MEFGFAPIHQINQTNIGATYRQQSINNLKISYWWNKERNPGHHDKHGGGQIDGEDEGAQGPAQSDLKTINTVVA